MNSLIGSPWIQILYIWQFGQRMQARSLKPQETSSYQDSVECQVSIYIFLRNTLFLQQ